MTKRHVCNVGLGLRKRGIPGFERVFLAAALGFTVCPWLPPPVESARESGDKRIGKGKSSYAKFSRGGRHATFSV